MDCNSFTLRAWIIIISMNFMAGYHAYGSSNSSEESSMMVVELVALPNMTLKISDKEGRSTVHRANSWKIGLQVTENMFYLSRAVNTSDDVAIYEETTISWELKADVYRELIYINLGWETAAVKMERWGSEWNAYDFYRLTLLWEPMFKIISFKPFGSLFFGYLWRTSLMSEINMVSYGPAIHIQMNF